MPFAFYRSRNRAVAGGNNAKKAANFVRFENPPAERKLADPPPKLQRSIMFKQKKHFGGSAKPKIAKLSHGILKILEVDVRDANKRDQMAMHKAVDLGHDDVRYDDSRREFQVIYQRVEYRLWLTDNSGEEYRSFRDALREHTWFRQQLIDEGIESVTDYVHKRAETKKSDACDKLRKSAEIDVDVANNAKKTKEELAELLTRTVNGTVHGALKAQSDDLKTFILKEVSVLKQNQNSLFEELLSLRNYVTTACDNRERKKQKKRTVAKSQAEVPASGRSSSSEESDEEASTKEEAAPVVAMKRQSTRAVEQSLRDVLLQSPTSSKLPRRKPVEMVAIDDLRSKKTTQEQTKTEEKTSDWPAATVNRPTTTIVRPQPAATPATTTTRTTPPPAVRAGGPSTWPIPRRRDCLPRQQVPGSAISLTQLANLPLHAFEPLSVLQMVCEELCYAKPLLDNALQKKLPLDRMCSVVAFAFSAYPAMTTRKRKPFNPLLGETFDLVSADGWRYHSEQVSHHPPISACHAVGNGWEWWQDLRLKSDFSLLVKTASVSSTGITRLRLNGKEEYSWNRVPSTIANADAAAEKRTLTLCGDLTIRSSTGFEATLKFKEDKSVKGKIITPTKQADVASFRVTSGNQQEEIFKPEPQSNNQDRHYGFSRFAMALNDLIAEERPFLPRTDSRFRPDQRCLENGDVENGAKLKHMLEEAQRARKQLPHRQMWFQSRQDAFAGRELWTTNGKYWDSRAAQFRNPHSQAMLKLFDVK